MTSDKITFSTEVVGMLDVNCYLVNVPESKTLYIIDPGSEADKISIAAKRYDYEKCVVLLTHAHVDHISGLGELCELLDVACVYLHPDDLQLYNSPNNHLMPYVPVAKNLPEIVTELKSDDFKIIHTPGHSRGGVCYLFDSISTLFSGDTIFCQSIGRTDFHGGDQDTLLSSIKDKILTLPEDLKIYPGHGPATTVGSEKLGNPYL